ncbi:MAG: single-stranded DNA-binding protein [Verrucomicrobia bacterium]|jgi:single-strand DNA-binding protein|nr:MAG: single-stranded DNA-binding protein [Verrucomicrobiota bacterium]
MASYNKVMIIGNLTRDPEIKYTPKGTAIADIGLAVNRNYTTESGEKREEVTFIDVTLWGRVAEIVGEYCKKGRPLFVEGRLQLDSWDDKATGQKRSKLKVVGENIQLLGSREGGSGGGEHGEGRNEGRTENRPAQSRSAPSRPATPPQRPPADPDLDAPEDDIPF